MAITADCNKIWKEITFSAATTPPTVASSTELVLQGSTNPTGNSSHSEIASQFAKITATTTNSNTTATVVFFLADNDSVGSLGAGKIWEVTATITAGTTRQSHSTAAGDYVATVVLSAGTFNNLDLFGVGRDGTWPKWYAGCTAIANGPFTIRYATGRAI
jgi:hypothetical protein